MAHKKFYKFLVLLNWIFLSYLFIAPVAAMSPKAAYHQAENCSKQLHDSSVKMKYRDKWLQCIEKFQQVYRMDPGG